MQINVINFYKIKKINKPEHSKQVYGKTLPIHFERENIQGDGLID